MAGTNQVNPGNYEKVPLRKDVVTACVMQSQVISVDAANPASGRKQNLEHLLDLIDMTAPFSHADILVFHEFPLAAMDFTWNREQAMRVAIDVPGEETEAVAAKAKQYNCYIHFGCYGKIKEWPGHFINLGIIIGPTGEVLQRRWKTRNMSGMGFSTTIYDVLDQYVEMYGWDAVFPVCRTDIGNIGIIPETMEPELGRAYAFKGAEIMIRYMTAGAGACQTNPIAFLGGDSEHTFRTEFQGICISCGFFGLFVNNSLSPLGLRENVFDLGAGHSAIFDNNGHLMTEAASSEETMVTAMLPLAEYRRTHTIPNFPKELYMKLYEEYVPRFPANLFQEQLPNSIMDAMAQSAKLARW